MSTDIDAGLWTPPKPVMRMSLGNSSGQSLHQQLQMHVRTTPSGLRARLELESDTVEIYDRSNDSFQYSLKGDIELDWKTNAEILLKEARIDFVGYADSAVIRQEAAASTTAGGKSDAPVYHTTDTIPTPLVLAQALPPNMEGTEADAQRGHQVLPIDLTLPGHLPESMAVTVGTIRYEIQALLTFVLGTGTSTVRTETLVLSRPVVVHRITYPSGHLQPRVVMGLDSGGVEIQAKLPRQMHCENTLLAVEIDARPRTPNIKLTKLRVVFEQIETDRFTRSASLTTVPRAVPWTSTEGALVPESQSALLPTPRLVTTTIAQPLEINLEENPTILMGHPLQLQLVLSPNLCVDVHSHWIRVHHLLRVEVEYFTLDETKQAISEATLQEALASANSAIVETTSAHNATYHSDAALALALAEDVKKPEYRDNMMDENNNSNHIINYNNSNSIINHHNRVIPQPETESSSFSGACEANPQDLPPPFSSLAAGETSLSNYVQASSTPSTSVSSPRPPNPTGGGGGGGGVMTPHATDEVVVGGAVMLGTISGAEASSEMNISSSASLTTATTTTGQGHVSLSPLSLPSLSVATEEIPIRVVRVVKTGLVDASTLAQAAGETEVGLPTYESVIEATGLPAYVEEKDEEEYEEAEASGTASGVLGGAARLIEEGENP
ncbi:hypothetical protein DFQ26_006492 [Actinomortierella ambigua]|nr:hypothetical protein DFQ26_006492 [Actinomortierella ambigua]